MQKIQSLIFNIIKLIILANMIKYAAIYRNDEYEI